MEDENKILQENTNVEETLISTSVESQIESIPTSQKSSKNSSKLFKSWIFWLSLVVVIIGCITTILVLEKHNREEAYAKTLKTYKTNLTKFVEESDKAVYTYAYICEDLRSIWHDFIFDDKEYFNSSTGDFTTIYGSWDEHCYDFSEAVNKKIDWNKKHLPSSLDDPYDKAKRLYKKITPAPEEYKDLHIYVKQMYKSMEKIHDLSLNPRGNYSTYTSDCIDVIDDYMSARSDVETESDIELSRTKSHRD